MLKTKKLRILQQNDNAGSLSDKDQILLNQLPIFLSGNLAEVDKQDEKGCQQLLELIKQNQIQLGKIIQQTKNWVTGKQFNQGIGFYNCKNIVFIKYLTYLNLYKLFKINAVSFTEGTGLQLYQKLVQTKTLLLKLAPIQKKLQYQTNKMLRAQIKPVEITKPKIKQPVVSNKDALSFKPRIQHIKVQSASKSDKYIAPKLSSTLPGEEKEKSRIERQKERRKAFLVRKFRGDIMGGEQPREEGLQSQLTQKLNSKMEDKIRAQEDNFTRFRQTKKEKMWRKRVIKDNQRGDDLNKQLQEIKLIREIFEENQNKKRH